MYILLHTYHLFRYYAQLVEKVPWAREGRFASVDVTQHHRVELGLVAIVILHQHT